MVATTIQHPKSYYFDFDKFVRDLVHGYVYLTKFDIELISTAQFQRLRDIRQLTCQSVYPDARHTRFEHSLGVMELTRQAINNLNANGFICDDRPSPNLISEQLQFNASIAALLHDIGHCPFSHMGEIEFNRNNVWERLYNDIVEFDYLKDSSLATLFKKIHRNNTASKPGSVHEQLSCIMILEEYKEILTSVKSSKIKLENDDLFVDFELIIRSILGIEYDVNTDDEYAKNAIVNLINSKAFDMDKLDYVMRDSLYTGIGAPHIDTNRLFRNMYLHNENDYKLIFKNRAVPSLQNFIESRDALYMYVYNHHTSVFSDFMNSYIFRRLEHNRKCFINLIDNCLDTFNQELEDKEKTISFTKEQIDNSLRKIIDLTISVGIISKNHLFSVDSVICKKLSDSDLISLLNSLHYSLNITCNSQQQFLDNIGKILNVLFGNIAPDLNIQFIVSHPMLYDKLIILQEDIDHTYQLIKNYQCHKYLKPWWKTNSEFKNFISSHFADDPVSSQLCEWIWKGNQKIERDEFCSQIVKNVIYITNKLIDEKENNNIIEPLKVGEFFIIQRSARFFDPDTINEFFIAMKSNEIFGSLDNIYEQSGEYYIKRLTNVMPQRMYYSMYAKDSFYVFSKRLSDSIYSLEERKAYYRTIEQIFTFVAKSLIEDGDLKFSFNYNTNDKTKELRAHKKMYERYKKYFVK